MGPPGGGSFVILRERSTAGPIVHLTGGMVFRVVMPISPMPVTGSLHCARHIKWQLVHPFARHDYGPPADLDRDQPTYRFLPSVDT